MKQMPYECKLCGCRRYASFDESCTQEWLEKLHPMLACNDCFDDHHKLSEAKAELSKVKFYLRNGFRVEGWQIVKLSQDESTALQHKAAHFNAVITASSQRLLERKKTNSP